MMYPGEPKSDNIDLFRVSLLFSRCVIELKLVHKIGLNSFWPAGLRHVSSGLYVTKQ